MERTFKISLSDGLKILNINVLNTFFLFFAAISFFFVLIVSSKVNSRFLATKTAFEKFSVCEQASKEIKESLTRQTELARLFVINLDTKYALSYINEIEVTRTHQGALKKLEKICTEKDLALQRVKIALSQAESLVNMELYAIRLGYECIGNEDMPQKIREIQLRDSDLQLEKDGLQKTAVKNLFGEGYLIYKSRINENCNLTVSSIEEQIKEDLNLSTEELGTNLSRLNILFIALLIANVMIFLALALLVLFPLKQFQDSIKNGQKLAVAGPQEFQNLAQAYNEIYDMKEKNTQSLLEKAEYDALTGILNKRAFDQICKTSAEKKTSIAMLLIDMDNFKHINDTYGHSGGDKALQELARILTQTFRKDDYIARIGDDEFAAVLKDFKQSSSNIIVEKIREVNDKLSKLDEKIGVKSVSISVGAAYSFTGFSEHLFKNASKALQSVKESGRRGCRVYEKSMG